MNEKIYMPVEETNRMNEEEKGFCLYNEMLYEDVDSLVEKYNDKRLMPIIDRKSVGIMSIPASGVKKVFHKFNYVVYSVNDNKEFLINSAELKFKDALLFARIICKQNVCECFIVNGHKKIVPVSDKESLRNDYFKASYDVIENSNGVKKNPLHSNYVKAYTEMTKRCDEPSEKYAKIRHRHK